MNLKKLFNRLNSMTRSTLSKAVESANQFSHPAVELEHWLLQLLEYRGESDFAFVLKHFEIDTEKAASELRRTIVHFRKGSSGGTPVLSSVFPRLIAESWSLASIEYEDQQVRSGHLLQTLLDHPELCSKLYESCPTLMRLNPTKVAAMMPEILHLSPEQTEGQKTTSVAGKAETGETTEEKSPREEDEKLNYPNLSRFGSNLTTLASLGKVDPVIGRDTEVQQLCEILLRRRQNNPIITGDAGVGKTAVAEGLALLIAQGKAPAPLAHIQLWSLDLGSLKAGAGVRGEYEQRIKSVINEVKDAPIPIILFVDEAHLLMGGGGSGEPSDTANLIKPELARGELRMIAATTWSEYKRYIEKDAALARRFQVVKVREPSLEHTSMILHGIKEKMVEHHKVDIEDEAIDSSISLSDRYIVGRKLPDKAIAVLDTSCARIQLRSSQQDTPESESTEEEHVKNQEEKDQTKKSNGEEKPRPKVTAQDVGDVVSDWTGIPLGNLLSDRVAAALSLEEQLNKRVIGQSEALSYVVRQIKSYLANLSDTRKPMGTMLLVGPSGVGKTETAITLAETFFGDERNIVTINMSEYQEAHTVSNLKGAPPGYVGYGQGGILTEAVRRNPYSLILLDEIEKAHHDVIEMFYQVLDKGWMEDSEGNEADFANCIILMTSNAGSDIIFDKYQKSPTRPSVQELNDALSPELQRVFKPAFLGRVQLVPYYPLDNPALSLVTNLKLNRLKKRFHNAHEKNLHLDEAVVQDIVQQCQTTPVGARFIDNLISSQIQPKIADLILQQLAQDKPIQDIFVSLDEKKNILCSFEPTKSTPESSPEDNTPSTTPEGDA